MRTICCLPRGAWSALLAACACPPRAHVCECGLCARAWCACMFPCVIACVRVHVRGRKGNLGEVGRMRREERGGQGIYPFVKIEACAPKAAPPACAPPLPKSLWPGAPAPGALPWLPRTTTRPGWRGWRGSRCSPGGRPPEPVESRGLQLPFRWWLFILTCKYFYFPALGGWLRDPSLWHVPRGRGGCLIPTCPLSSEPLCPTPGWRALCLGPWLRPTTGPGLTPHTHLGQLCKAEC